MLEERLKRDHLSSRSRALAPSDGLLRNNELDRVGRRTEGDCASSRALHVLARLGLGRIDVGTACADGEDRGLL